MSHSRQRPGRSTAWHGVDSALSRNAFVGGFDCGVEVAHAHMVNQAWQNHCSSTLFKSDVLITINE
jgi:hypothetical protein